MSTFYVEISRECSGRNSVVMDSWQLTSHVVHVKRGVTGAVITYKRLHALSAWPDDST